MAEILAITDRPTLIRVGSCGVLQADIALGDLVITRARSGSRPPRPTSSETAIRPWPTTRRWRPSSRRRRAWATPPTSGITATAPGFFGAQGRPIARLPIRFPDLAADMARQGVLNFEMEASALLVLAGLAGCRAGVVCAAYAQRTTGRFVQGAAQEQAETACIETGLEALRILAEMDEATRAAGAGRWRPSLWAPAWRPEDPATRRSRGRRSGPPPSPGASRKGGDGMAEAYCVKCKAKREVKNAQHITMKNGKPALQGTCPVCGTKVFKIGG